MRMSVLFLVVFCLAGAVPSVQAQTTDHVVGQSTIDQALQQHVAQSSSDREVVRRLLERPEVRALAGEAGLDLRRAETAVSMLEGDELARVASQARQAERALAGGQSSVTLQTTWIIIGLLVIILLIVALR